MIAYLRNLQSERDSLTQAATQITETAAGESRDVTESERASIVTMGERCAVIDSQLETFGAQLDSQRAYAALRASLAERDADGAPQDRLPATRDVRPAEARGWGRAFVESAEFRSYDGHGSSGRVDVPGLFQSRAAIDSTSPWGALNPPMTWARAEPSITTPLLDAVGHVQTNSLTIQWLQMPQPVSKAVKTAEGALKTEAANVPTPITGTLETYAHWQAITRQALFDIPQIQSIVSDYLNRGLFSALEDAVVAAMAGGTYTNVDIPATGGNPIGAIRTAVALAQEQGFPSANTVAMNPLDWANLDVSVMATANGLPTSQNAFWGLRPVASNGIPVGKYYVGDLARGVTLFDNGAASVYMSDSHADFFIRNQLVILAETMAVALVTQGKAIVTVTQL